MTEKTQNSRERHVSARNILGNLITEAQNSIKSRLPEEQRVAWAQILIDAIRVDAQLDGRE